MKLKLDLRATVCRRDAAAKIELKYRTCDCALSDESPT